MKTLLFAAALSLFAAAPLWAQTDDSSTTPSDSSTPKHHHHGGARLTKEEWQELKAAHDSALKSNPALVTEEKQLREEQKAHMKKLHDAMVQADPNVEPILAKLKAGHHHHHHEGGDATNSTDSDNS